MAQRSLDSVSSDRHRDKFEIGQPRRILEVENVLDILQEDGNSGDTCRNSLVEYRLVHGCVELLEVWKEPHKEIRRTYLWGSHMTGTVLVTTNQTGKPIICRTLGGYSECSCLNKREIIALHKVLL